MLRKNVASQVLTFNLVNATTGAALTGATVTTKVALDGTQSAGAGTVTELGTGQYKYVPTQGETNGASVGFSFTATNAVPVNLHCFTIGQDPALTTFDVNVTKLLGTAWLTPGTAGTPDVNVKLWNALTTVELPLVPTTAGRKLDVTTTGEAGIDWANIGAPTTTVNLSGTTIATTQKVDIETIKTNPVVNAGTITFPTTATLASTTNITAGTVTTATNVTTVNGLAANVITATSIAADAITAAKIATNAIDADAIAADAVTEIQAGLATPTNITAGIITTVTNLTNAPTAGDFTATMKTSIGTAVAASAVASVTGNVGGNVVGSVGSVVGLTASNLDATVSSRASSAALATVQADTDDIQTRLPAALTAAGNIKADIEAINGTEVIGDGAGTPWGPV